MTTRTSNIIWGIVVLAVIAVGVVLLIPKKKESTPAPQGSVESAQKVTIEGNVVCLPHRDTSGPTTMECAYGLKTDDGKYYSLDGSKLPANEPPAYKVGDRIAAEGELLSQADIPTNTWNTYAIDGTIVLDSFWKYVDK